MLEPGRIDRARSGDPDAVDELLRICWPQAYRISLGILGDRGLAEDAAQEAASLIAMRIQNLQDVKAFGSWFYRIVTRAAISLARQQKPTLPLKDALSARYSSDFVACDILDAISRLPVSQRSPVILKYYVGLNSSEIGSVLKISPALVRFRLMLGRRALQLHFTEPCIPKGTVTDV